MNLAKEFKAVRAVGTPIVAVKSSNQPETIKALGEAAGDKAPLIRWDAIRGLMGLNESGQAACATVMRDMADGMTADPVAALEVLAKFPDRSLTCMVNAHRYVEDARVATGIGNLREPYKGVGSTIVLLGPSFTLPAEILSDIILLSDDLPDDPALSKIVDFVYEQSREAKLKVIDPTPLDKEAAIAALRGLSSFGAEQQAFLSIQKKDGSDALSLDLDSLWERKKEAINAIPGLSMEYSKKTESSVRGLKALQSMLDRLFSEKNPERPGACVHIDEIDKALAGAGRQGAGDSSGVTQDQMGQLLQYMEDKGWDGIMSVGAPGVGKSMVSKTVASLYGVPYMRIDLGAMKGSLVGESEERIRLALETITRVAAGKVFVLATCNKLDNIAVELRRRFTGGIWYFDLPGLEDRKDIWKLYADKYKIKFTPEVLKWSEGWTGAEIRNVCRTSWRLSMTLDEARHLIVPIAESGKEDVDRLRQLAIGRFLDAGKGGKYLGPTTTEASPASKRLVEI